MGSTAWIGPAIQATASHINAILGHSLGMKASRKDAYRSYNLTKQLYDYQFAKESAYNEMMYNKYQSPVALMRQYREAGLNPNLIYGNAQPSGPAAPSVSAQQFRVNPSNYQGDYIDSRALGELAEKLFSKEYKLQMSMMESQAQQLSEEARGKKLQNDWLERRNKDMEEYFNNKAIVDRNKASESEQVMNYLRYKYGSPFYDSEKGQYFYKFYTDFYDPIEKSYRQQVTTVPVSHGRELNDDLLNDLPSSVVNEYYKYLHSEQDYGEKRFRLDYYLPAVLRKVGLDSDKANRQIQLLDEVIRDKQDIREGFLNLTGAWGLSYQDIQLIVSLLKLIFGN